MIKQTIINKLQTTYFLLRNGIKIMRGYMEANTRGFLPVVEKIENSKEYIRIAFRPTGGLGDYIISSKLLDELLTYGPCCIDVYCENVVFGEAIYAMRPGVSVLPAATYYFSVNQYDIAMMVEHFVHIHAYRANKLAKLSPILLTKIEQLKKDWDAQYVSVDTQCYRENTHFRRCEFLGINRWTEMRMGNIFSVSDRRTGIYLSNNYKPKLEVYNLSYKDYITCNFGADSMGNNKLQLKVWPKEYYEQLIEMLKNQYPEKKIIQLGSKNSVKLQGVNTYILGESLETIKWVLKYSKLHLDCEGGLVHLATQLSTKCMVIFGPTPAHMYAYPQNINLIYDKCNNCMGTHEKWAFECLRALEKPECMYGITPDLVFIKIQGFLNEKEEIKNTQYLQWISKEDLYEKYLINQNKKKLKIAILDDEIQMLADELKESGCEVVIFDDKYGYKVNEPPIFGKVLNKRRANGIDSRFGCALSIPYHSSEFDFVIWNKGNNESGDVKREIERILKKQGVCYYK